MYIFLDIDGVLNKKSQWRKMYSLDEICIKNFCDFAHKVNGKIILTSSWRTGFISTKNTENSEQIKYLENLLEQHNIKISDKTPKLNGRSRDKEIERFLYFNPNEKYIVIDDDKQEYEQTKTCYYFVNANNGFTQKDIKGAMKCI